MALVI